jgi:hypothetical protein
VSEAARDNVILLPLYHTMTAEEQQSVIDQLATIALVRKAG